MLRNELRSSELRMGFLGGLLWIFALWCRWFSGMLRVLIWLAGNMVSVMEGLDWGSRCHGVRWSFGLLLDKGGAKVFVVREMGCGACGNDRGVA